MDRSEDHDEIGTLEGLAVGADDIVKLLERIATGNHIDDVHAYLHDKLLGDNNPKTKLFAKRMLP